MNSERMRQVAERVVKSFGFSVFCCAVWCVLSTSHVRALLHQFEWMELIWLVYNATLAMLFLVRTRPSVVSLNPVHWVVALLTSFAGLFFERNAEGIAGGIPLGNGLILLGLAISGSSALALGRSYDFLPALRGVTTGWLYACIRHPMYLSSIIIRLGYVLKHASLYNAALFIAMVALYDRRAAFEEQVMSNEPRYRAYVARVRYRFLPGLW